MTQTTIHYQEPTNMFADLTLDATLEAMQTLVIPGKTPHVKLSYYFAVCSIRTSIEKNQDCADVLRGYANRPLPVNRDELRAQLPCLMSSQINTLYEIEKLYNAGVIHMNTGTTFEEQAAWRRSMTAAIPGMGEKTVSFALHIYSPFTCQLLTIDVWHIRRILGRFDVSKVQSIRTKQYLTYEQESLQDCKTLLECEDCEGSTKYAPIVLAACLWERTRRYYGATKVGSGYTSHARLSCYV